jgi:hypothetical protein
MSQAQLELGILASERHQPHALDRASTKTGQKTCIFTKRLPLKIIVLKNNYVKFCNSRMNCRMSKKGSQPTFYIELQNCKRCPPVPLNFGEKLKQHNTERQVTRIDLE